MKYSIFSKKHNINFKPFDAKLNSVQSLIIFFESVRKFLLCKNRFKETQILFRGFQTARLPILLHLRMPIKITKNEFTD
jgi:hypothetical protein